MSVQQRRLARSRLFPQRGLQTFRHESLTYSLDCVGVDPELVRNLGIGVSIISGKEDERVFETTGFGTSPAGQGFKLGPFLLCQTNNVLLQRLFLLPARSKQSLHQSITEINVAVY
jgi:hypothetical protein